MFFVDAKMQVGGEINKRGISELVNFGIKGFEIGKNHIYEIFRKILK